MNKRIKRFLANVWGVINLPEMSVLPGQLAFFFVLSVVPIITLIGYGAAFLNLSMDFISDFINTAFSSGVAGLMFPEKASAFNLGFNFFVSLGLGFFFASNGADSIILTSNTIYGIPNSGYLKRRIRALVMTLLIVILFVFILIVPVFGKIIVEIIKELDWNFTVTRNVELIFLALRGPISWFIMFMFIKIIYTMAPDRRRASSQVNTGALFTTVLWTFVTAIYSIYITRFANYSMIYGGLANIVILMLWVYFLAYIFVIGMALNFREEETAKIGIIKQ